MRQVASGVQILDFRYIVVLQIHHFQAFTDVEVALRCKCEILRRDSGSYVEHADVEREREREKAYDTADKHIVHVQMRQLWQLFLLHCLTERFGGQHLGTFSFDDVCRQLHHDCERSVIKMRQSASRAITRVYRSNTRRNDDTKMCVRNVCANVQSDKHEFRTATLLWAIMPKDVNFIYKKFAYIYTYNFKK